MFVRSMLCAVFALAAGLPAVAQPPVGFADTLLGRWNLTIDDGTRQWPSWLEVSLRTESELMGRFVGRVGSVRHLPQIDWQRDTLTFTAPLQYERGDQPLQFRGAFAAGMLTGTLADENGDTLNWRAQRAPPLLHAAEYLRHDAIELFNGVDLSGWRPRAGDTMQCWHVHDGIATATPPCVDLISQREFMDFELALEFRLPEDSNSGLYLRGRYEVQLQETAGQAIDALRMGSVYGFIAPTHDAAGAAGEWQSMRIRLVGRRISVTLNGAVVIDGQRIPGMTGGALDNDEARPGPVMIQGDHGPIDLRRLTVTPLVAR